MVSNVFPPFAISQFLVNIIMRVLACSVLSILAVSLASREDDYIAYRLPKTVLPTSYEISIQLSEDSFAEKSFNGHVKIKILPQNSTNEIKLHASSLEISEAILQGYIRPKLDDYNETTEVLTLFFEEELKAGTEYELQLTYAGALDDKDMYGFYQSSYTEDGGTVRFLAITQFEPTYARRAFPCFDEPEFKAEFTITITSPRGYDFVASNSQVQSVTKSDDGSTITKFEATPKMSTYLIAFIVSQFVRDPSPNDNTFHVIHKSESNVNIVLEQGPKLLQALSEYTAIDYGRSMKKMDVAAVPDFAFGAMENWGLVIYREILLLDDGNDTSEYIKQRIVTTVAHEFTHQWFGDLVTLDWWSDTWLNEGFATYFENYITDLVNPDFEMMIQTILIDKQTIMVTDGFKSSESLSTPEDEVNTQTEASNRFADVSYSKGGSVIKMMSHFLDEDFQLGLRTYLMDLEYNNAKPVDLFKSFDKAADLSLILPKNTTMGDVMQNWIYNSGYPVITVNLIDENKAQISQERFLYDLDGIDDTLKWFVPLSCVSKSDSQESRVWITPSENLSLSLTVDDWILVNNEGKGYYRVNYDDTLWARIIKELLSDSNRISELNRVQLIDDAFNLARANKLPYATAFNLTTYLSNETSYYAWTAAFNSFSYILQRTGVSDLSNAISTILLGLIQELFEANQPERIKEGHIAVLNQNQALTWACNLGIDDCVNFAKTSFSNYKESDLIPNANFRSFVYCTALRNSDDSSDWQFLWEKYLKVETSAAEKNVILTALGCSRNKTILNDFLEKTVTDGSGIRKQDALTSFQSVYSGNPENVDVAYEFVKEKHQEIAAYYKGVNSVSGVLLGIVDLFTTQEQVDDLNAFLKTENLSDEFKIVGEQAVETAGVNLNWFKFFEQQLNDIFGLKK